MHLFKLVAAVAMTFLGLASSGQQAADPETTLRRTVKRVLEELDRMPRYTCVQTITRTYYDARPRSRETSCSTLVAAHASRHTPQAFGWDRLRLEVAWIEGNNTYSWVGEPRFSDDNLEKLAGEGPLGSGDFGPLLRETLLQATPNFQREQFINGKRFLEYSYDMPLAKSTYRVKTSDGWAPAAYSGTLLVDSEAADLVSMTMRAANLSSKSSTCQVISEITYGRIAIHDRLILLPRETHLDVINVSGTESQIQTAYENCREYASTSRLFLNDPKSTDRPQGSTSTAASQVSLSAGLLFDARIITPIDSDKAAAGDPIEAVLRSAIRGKNHEVIAPVGARIHGRINDLRWRSKPASNYRVKIGFESIEIDGRNVPLNATLEPPHPKVLTGPLSVPQMAASKPADTVIDGAFSFPREHFQVKNLDAQWVTVAPGAQKEK